MSRADKHNEERLGKVLAGEEVSFDRVSAFFTELFGTIYRFFGDSEGADRQELEGSFADGRAVVRYFDGGRLRAALATGLSDEEQNELEDRIREDTTRIQSEAA